MHFRSNNLPPYPWDNWSKLECLQDGSNLFYPQNIYIKQVIDENTRIDILVHGLNRKYSKECSGVDELYPIVVFEIIFKYTYNKNNWLLIGVKNDKRKIKYPPTYNVKSYNTFLRRNYEQRIPFCSSWRPSFPSYLFWDFNHIMMDSNIGAKLAHFIMANINNNNKEYGRLLELLDHIIIIKNSAIKIYIGLFKFNR